MPGRDKSVGWCAVETTAASYLLPRAEFDRLSARLIDRKGGWHHTEDVFGRTVLFRLRDITDLVDTPPDALAALEAAAAEDRLAGTGEDD